MARISAPQGRRLTIFLADLKVLKVMVNGRPFDLGKTADPSQLEVPGGVIEVAYEGVFQDQESNIIGEQGIVLRDIWYPVLAGRCLYTLTATLPRDYEAVSEADRIIKSQGDGTATFQFEFPHPLNDSDGLTFAASPRFQVSQASYREIEIYAYFFPEHAGLAPQYLEQARQFLEMYERLLGPYPYRRFSLVESFQPSAYSMPTYVLLGEREIGSDEYATSLLAHEILHQWFGNLVFTDFDRGNWNEGLTIYLADHLLEDHKGAGWQCRRRILSNFKSHVTARNEIPLRRFSEREDDVTRSVGYGKSAMVFHMLRRLVGEEIFFSGIREFVQTYSFRAASWDDLRKIFEKRARQDLSWFFSQWLNRVGLPEIRVDDVKVEAAGKQFRVAVTLSQPGPLYKLQVPVTFYREQVPRHFTVTLSRKKQNFPFLLASRPEELVIDENFEVFRKLSPAEDPATFKRLVARGPNLTVQPPLPADIAEDIIKAFKQRGVNLKVAKAGANGANAPHSATVLLGGDHPLIPNLLGNLEVKGRGFSAVIRKHPHAPEHLVAVFQVNGREEIEPALREMFTHRFYSDYVFQRGEPACRTLKEEERGLRVKVENDAKGFKGGPGETRP
uniref:Peptidase M1 membrane alanine aminopeptidase domain-containing protein n=1 Tax=Desulfobacca acetoxidans TaxID=60893 RepID=A0A7V4G8F6_9BACT